MSLGQVREFVEFFGTGARGPAPEMGAMPKFEEKD